MIPLRRRRYNNAATADGSAVSAELWKVTGLIPYFRAR